MSQPETRHRHEARLLGRESETEALLERISSGGVDVGIYGPPGVGKSSLARRLVRQWDPSGESSAFIDGRECSGIESLLDALVLELGLAPTSEFEPDEVIGLVVGALDERGEFLLVLDDIEHLRESLADLLGPLRSAGELRTVVTSRVALGCVDEAFTLEPLSGEASVELFVERGQRARPGFSAEEAEPSVLDALVAKLDCLPLAIELAAARLAILTPRDLLERLEERFRLLSPAHASRASAPMALSNALAISWDMLDDVQRSVLAQCSVFEGGFGLEAAEAVVSPDADDVWLGDVLQSLVTESLVSTRRERGASGLRFFLLESIRDYAMEQGEERDIAAARARHADYFVERADAWAKLAREPEGQSALKQLIRETANLDAACDALMSTDAARAAQLLTSLQQTFEVRGVLGEFLRRVETCLSKLESLDEPGEPLVRLTLSQARLLALGGRLERALECVDFVIGKLQSSDRRAGLAGEAFLQKGRILRELGRIDEAGEAWRRGLDDCRDPFWRAQLKGELGRLALNRARFGAVDGARDALQRGAELLADAYEWTAANAHALYRLRPAIGRALALHETGESERAVRLLEDELGAQHAAGHRHGELLCRDHLAILEFYAGRYERALEVAAAVERGLAEAGLAARRSRNLSCRAIFANAAGRVDEAAEFVREALDASEQSGQEVTTLVADVQGVMLAWEQGEDAALRTHLQRARRAAESIGSPGHASFVDAYESFVMAARGDLDEARELCEAAVEKLEKSAEYLRPPDAPRWETTAAAWRAILELCGVEELLGTGECGRLYDALEAVGRLEDAPDEPLTAVARRHARQSAERVRLEYQLPDRAPAHILRIEADGSGFRLDDRDPVDLSSRAPLRRVLCELAARAGDARGSADVDALVEVGWPDENLEPTSAANRVYATIRMLRKQGLSDVIVTDDDGYRLADDVWVRGGE